MNTPDRIPRFGETAPPLVENGYEPVPVHFGQKRPIPSEWQDYQFNESDLTRYASAGTGLLTGRTVGADIDVRDPDLAAQIEEIAERRLGRAPRRIGQAPKVLRLYQTGQPFTKIATRGYRFKSDKPEDKSHRVEILAKGQQLIAFNQHPDTGKPYEWNGAGDPLTVPVGMLAVVTEAQAREFIAEVDALLALHGRPVGRITQADEQREHTPNETQRATNVDLLRLALDAIPNDDLEFDDWIRIAYAVKGALGDAGLADFLKWSAKSSKDRVAFSAQEFLAAKPVKIGAGTIHHVARQAGWRRPQTNSDEDDTGDAPPDWPEPVNILSELSAPEFTANDLPPMLAEFRC